MYKSKRIIILIDCFGLCKALNWVSEQITTLFFLFLYVNQNYSESPRGYNI